jgi:hypothetical protein
MRTMALLLMLAIFAAEFCAFGVITISASRRFWRDDPEREQLVRVEARARTLRS